MVRSKFPGKPSKIVNRKVVKSSKYRVLYDNESSKAAENISYGLAVFNETFGDHDRVLTSFHGFSPHEVDKAKDTAKKQQEKVDEEYRTYGLNFSPDDAFPVKIDPPTPQVLSYVAANLSLIGAVGGHTTRAQSQNLYLEIKGDDLSKSISPSKYFSPVKTNFKKHVANRLLQRAKKANLESSTLNKLTSNSQLDPAGSPSVSGLNRKFVLPCRSARSSRVIKPNKRFLDSDGREEDPLTSTDTTGQPSHSRVIELKKPRLILDGEVNFTARRSDSKINSSGGKFTREVPLSNCTDSKNTEHVKLAELNVFGAPTTRPKRRISQSSMDESPKKDESVVSRNPSTEAKSNRLSDSNSPSRSKLILRESKLNISSATDKATEGLFSAKPKKGLKVIKSPGTSVECGVCGAVCCHRLTKQSLKFGLICCDPCCKFVAKMMVRAKSSENSVPCENGQGNCAVSSPLKGESFATKVNRCGACWLLLCVQRLVKLPENIRDGLIRMLPANMQGMTVLLPPVTLFSSVTTSRNRRRKGHSLADDSEESLTSIKLSPKLSSEHTTPTSGRKLPTSTNKRMTQTPIARIKRKAALVSLANNLKRVRDKTFSPVKPPGSIKKIPCELLEKPSKMKKKIPSKKPEARLKNSEKSLKKGSIKTLGKNKDGQTRQKLTLKGPRVKHVCRSASIVLGQPLATFPNKSPGSSSCTDVINEVKVASSFSTTDTILEATSFKIDEYPRETRSKGQPKVLSVEEAGDIKEMEVKSASASNIPLPPSESNTKLAPKVAIESRINQNSGVGRKITRLPTISSQNKMFQRGQRRTLQDLGVYSSQAVDLPELISLDFWESYDPDEVCNTGFGLIGFDPFHMKPVCFLCGSAGKKKLIHCASCCEPYHQFCVEMGVLGGTGPLLAEDQSKKEVWRVDWVCPRCTVCHGCGYNTGHQLTICQRCHHSYHQECLGTTALRKSAADRLWICASCLRCKSCNSADVTKFVGNLPFCKVCFKLRQKGNFCPLCQGCYTDDDYQSKMMECADCKSWVHAKCEGLSDEKYQVLSYLPESVEFICRLCCVVPPAPWWVAVEAELQAGYNNIIKSITKNRKAYAMLKWSPQKSCVCQHRLAASSSRIAGPVLALGKRRLSFNIKSPEDVKNILVVSQKPSDHSQICKVSTSPNEDQVSSVFEFDEDIDAGENGPITKYTHAKEKIKCGRFHQEYANLHLDCGSEAVVKTEKSAQFSPNTGSQSDSGVGSTDDELKTATEEEEVDEIKADMGDECTCLGLNSRPPFPTLLTIKKKVHSREYSSILEFHRDMDVLINEADSHEVKELYHQTLQEVFPWFDPKYDKVTRNSFPLSPCKPHHGSRLQYQSNSATPEKLHTNYSTSLQILERLLPKGTSKLDDEYFYWGMNSSDTRICGFCKLTGDSDACAEGRLLYCGHNEWVHINCALWSAEVFEEIDGALQNVSNALSRGRMIRCSKCGRKGASVGCCAKKCEETLHFPCARLAGFVFMEDKNVYCPLHTKDAPGKPLTKLSDFDICRPVFVELDRRKKKSIESRHVRLMIGSLLVQNLGTIVPDMSDLGSSIIPTQFCCTRQFWSSKEPWRIVSYTIQTTIRLPAPEPVVDLGHHITVDHSKETSSSSMPKSGGNSECCSGNQANSTSIHCKMKEDATGGDTLEIDQKTSDSKIVEAVVSHLLDVVCSKEADEEGTDAQNPADLLPPELKDAIFEDLPHDLLDGISMQDIFQDKFLNFDELSKDESQEESGTSGPVKCDLEKQKIRTFKAPRELKRSKSDVLPSNSSQVDSRLHQRSCSLAWSYKLGTNITCCKTQKLSTSEVVLDRTKLIQELRLSVKPAPNDLRYCLPGPGDKGKENQSLAWSRIMQVDGVSDAVLSGSDEGSDVEAVDKELSHMQQTKSFSPHKIFSPNFAKDSELLCNRIECLKTLTSVALSQNSVVHTCNEFMNQDFRKCKRRRFIKKMLVERKGVTDPSRHMSIPQLDGTNDASSDSEQEGVSHKLPQECDEKPVRCNRCGCTYRTEESHARHLPSCSGDYSLTTSESEAEMSEDEAVGTAKSVSAPSPDSAISVSSCSLSVAASASPIALPAVSPTPHPITSTSAPDSGTVKLNTSITHTGNRAVLTNAAPSFPSIQRPLNPMQGAVTASFSKVQRISSNKSKATKLSSQQQSVKLMVKENQSVLQHVFEQRSHQQIIQPSLQHSLPTSIAHQPQQASQVITMMDYQQSQQQGPTVLVQSVPSQAMVPAYLEAFHQHTGQNLQYLATVDTNMGYGKTQYLTAVPSTVVPGAYQLQAMPDGHLCLEPNSVGISTISGIQLAQAQLAPAPIAQAQPQVLGTLLQSPLSCGVVATTEPIYETIQMFPDQSGGVLLASQPMLTCMETVVSNTYMSMSSSQFVSSSVPGMLQGSSTFSTTTTQVFQASKADPPVLDVPTQYLVVNAHPSMSMSQPQIQEQPSIQSRAQIQIPSINLPVPVTVTAPLPPQTLPPVIPTSVVTPMPRAQPQRTYSKPSKVAKDNSVATMKRQALQTCPAVRQINKTVANWPAPKSVKEVATSLARTVPCPIEMSDKPDLAESTQKKPVVLQAVNILKNSLPTPVSARQLPSMPITINTAPAQSVTLPDPVTLTPPVVDVPKVTPVLDSPAAVKCPPVTFSYRAHAVGKSKTKYSNSSTVAGDTSGGPEDRVQSTNRQPAKQGSPHVTDSSQALVVASSVPFSSQLMGPSTFVGENSTGEHRSYLFSIKKPTAAVLPQSQLIAKVDPQKIETVKMLTPNTACSSNLSANLKLAVSKASLVLPALSQPTNSTVVSQPNVLPPKRESSPSQVGKNISLSLTTASITDSLTSTATTLTASSNSSVPVTTTKLQSASVAGLQPLKEINQTNLNTEVKPVPQKNQEKEAASVHPSVLKSTSQNVDATKTLCQQGELPLVFSNGDSSTSLKLLFQKQAHNGCYKVSSSPGKKDGELMAVKLADITIITNSIKDKKGGKDENMKPVDKTKKNQTGPPAPEIVYEIHCQDGFSYSSTSISDAWQKVFGAVQEARANHKMPPLIHNPFNTVESGHNVMGLGNNSLKYLLEQLPGVGNCTKYRPVYHKSRLPGPGYQHKREDHDLRESRSGCARTDPYLSAKKYDMFSWLDSRHRRPPKLLENNDIDSLTGSRRAASTSLPMAMRFRHLRETSKTSVGVFRSDIHGRGLFCLRDIEAGEMVIEYAGEVIRNTLTDNREKYYQSKGIGCYMFKVDDNFTVDATQKGNAARFINHSCEPNCYSRVVDILGKKHIIIFAFRRIPQGEELTYDYKFPIEDEKIHCHCLARRCRKYLN